MTSTQPASSAAISGPRAAAAIAIVLVALVGGLVASRYVDGDTPLLVAVATPFIIVEFLAKAIEFILHGNETPDWFAAHFEKVRIPVGLAAASFIAANQADEHTGAAIAGLAALVVILLIARALRPRTT